MSDVSESSLAEVHVCWGQPEADIIVGYLASRGIPAVLRGEPVYKLTVDGMGATRIMVAAEHAERARALIEERQAAADDPDEEEEQANS